MIEMHDNTFVIDTGPDFRQQMLREDIRKLDAVIFTHEHNDHLSGLDDIRAFNFASRKPVEIYATTAVQTAIRRMFPYIFEERKYPGIPELNFHTIDSSPFTILGSEFHPIDVMHHKLPVKAFRIGDLTYITDANYISEADLKKIAGSRIIIINALRREEHISHFTLKEAVDLLVKLKPEKGYLTHISHQLGLHNEISKGLPSWIQPAYDGLKVEV